jgi:hypothetical protein
MNFPPSSSTHYTVGPITALITSLYTILDKYNNTAIVQHSFLILPFVTSRHIIYSTGQISPAKRASERRHMDDEDEDV